MKKEKAHKELGFKRGNALRKVTGKNGVDWFFMTKKYPLKAKEIKAHKLDQEWLINFKAKMEKEIK